MEAVEANTRAGRMNASAPLRGDLVLIEVESILIDVEF
jgi:hypothetical protein